MPINATSRGLDITTWKNAALTRPIGQQATYFLTQIRNAFGEFPQFLIYEDGVLKYFDTMPGFFSIVSNYILIPANLESNPAVHVADSLTGSVTLEIQKLGDSGVAIVIPLSKPADDPTNVKLDISLSLDGTTPVITNDLRLYASDIFDSLGGSGNGPPPVDPPTCTITITAPTTIAADSTLNYTVSNVSGATVFQSWLVQVGSGSTPDGAVWVDGQIPESTGPGAFTNNITAVPPGNYLIWARVNDGGTCQDTVSTKPITITAAVAGPPPAVGIVPNGAAPGTYGQLTFREEFTNGYDGSKWNTGMFWYNNTDFFYEELNNYDYAGGNARIWLAKRSDGRYQFLARALTTHDKFVQRYGWFEVRAKLGMGQGAWPSFWLYAHKDANGNFMGYRPEIDIMECFIGDPDGYNFSNFHGRDYAATVWQTDASGNPSVVGKRRRSAGTVDAVPPPGNDLSTTFHTYACKWESDGITFYFDGVQVGTKVSTSFFTFPMYMIIAMGQGRDGDNQVAYQRSPSGAYDTNPVGPGTIVGPGAAYEVEYVRAWALPSGTTTGGSNTNPTAPWGTS